MADPNWYLSTASQSSAAIVGLIGGFLFSRLLGLMADRSSLESRIEEKQATVARLEEEEEEAVNQVEKLRVKAFLSIVARSIRTEDPLPTLDETLTRWNEEGSLDCAILTPEYDSLTSRILQAREFIRSHAMLLTHSTTDFGQWLKDNKLDLSGIDYDEAQHVFGTEVERLQKEYRESLAKVPGARPMIPLVLSGINQRNIL